MAPQRIIYLPLERYKSRYTNYTSGEDGVYETCFKELGIKFQTIRPNNSVQTIHKGRVLDTGKRTSWGFRQIEVLVNGFLNDAYDPEEDVIFLEDFWTPGAIEQIPYVQSQVFGPNVFLHVPVFSFCHAQSTDPYDFTSQWSWWMRPLEKMWFGYQKKIFCAARQMYGQLADGGISLVEGNQYKVRAVGHAFNKAVMERVAGTNGKEVPPWKSRTKQVVYSSRLDAEKNPHFFIDLVEAVHKERSDILFIICSGGEIRSNDAGFIARLQKYHKGNLIKAENRTLQQYYNILRASRVQFNCAYQDFISYTLLDAVINGCAPLYPNWLTFPDALDKDTKYLYTNLDLEDAKQKLYAIIDYEEQDNDFRWVYERYEDTVKHMCMLMGFGV